MFFVKYNDFTFNNYLILFTDCLHYVYNSKSTYECMHSQDE